MLRLTDVELVWNYGLCNFHQYDDNSLRLQLLNADMIL